MFANELDRRYGDQGIVSTSVHPGLIVTDLFRNYPKFIISIGVRFYAYYSILSHILRENTGLVRYAPCLSGRRDTIMGWDIRGRRPTRREGNLFALLER